MYYGAKDGRYACRRCLNLAYSSEAESRLGRIWRQHHKIEAKLDTDCEKPKGMHWRTYEKLCGQLEDIAANKDQLFLARVTPLLTRLG